MKKLILGTILSTSLFAGLVNAQEVKESKEILFNIEKNNPEFKGVQEVRLTPIPGMYEIRINNSDIFYSDKEGKTLFFGELIQNQNGKKVNLTENRVNSLITFDFKNINKADALVRKVGNGKNVLVTFEDPNCGYCKKLNSEINQLKDVTVYTYIVPILGPNSLAASKSIWCSSNRQKAWDAYMDNKTITNPNPTCDISALERNMKLAEKHRVKGTPMLFFANGKIAGGYIPANQIMEILNKK